MKILIIFTGGTIGSTVQEGFISPDAEKPYRLLAAYKEQVPNTDVVLETCHPYTVLSENLTGRYLSLLGNCVVENLGKDYDGLIVAHGTDTLQYAAAMTGYLTGADSIPVVFVSSNYVLDDKRANGLANFICAVDFIEKQRGRGTFLAYRNRDENVYMHRAARVLPHLPYSDEVYSMANRYYGVYKPSGQGTEAEAWSYQPNLEYAAQKEEHAPFHPLPGQWKSDILRIFPYPGMEYPVWKKEPRAVLLETYHSGTICRETPGFEEFLARAKKCGVPVFITGANTETDYASVQDLPIEEAFVLRNLSPVAAYMKLWLALETDENVGCLMQAVMADDIIL